MPARRRSLERVTFWRLNKGKSPVILLGTLAFCLFLLSSASAQGKGYGVEVRLMGPSLFAARPGEIISVSFMVKNTGRERVLFVENLLLPKGWQLITPPDLFDLSPGEESVRVLAFQIPQTAEAREEKVVYSVTSKKDASIRDEISLTLNVTAIKKLQLFLESAPDSVVAGESYEIKAQLVNHGNEVVKGSINAKSSAGLILSLSQKEFLLNPNENVPFTVTVQTQKKRVSSSFSHLVTLEAVDSKDPSTRVSLSISTEILSQASNIDMFQRIPAWLTLRTVGAKEESQVGGFDVELAGKGSLDDVNRREVEFLFTGPDTEDKGFYGKRNEYYLNYSDNNVDLRLGDENYGLSYLTSYSRYGRGLEARYHPGNKGLGIDGYYVESRFEEPCWDERGVSISGILSPSAGLSLNYLEKRENGANSSLPTTKDDIYSLCGTFNPNGYLKIDLEYARGSRQVAFLNLNDEAYRAEISGNAGPIQYDLNKTHAGPDFYGYYNDCDYISGTMNFPLFRFSQARGYFSFSHYETNLDISPEKGDTSTQESLFQTGINIPLSRGWYVQFSYDDFHRKDRLSPPQYDIREEAYRFGIGQAGKEFSYYLEARYANQYDALEERDASPWNYSFYATYLPTDSLQFTLYGGLGDEKALEGSRLLSSQSSLGCSFRWLASERLTLTGWYTKYNFNSKNPESDQCDLELKYTMPDESYWSLGIRRYQWDYGDYSGTDYLLSYSMPLGIPVGKKKSLGSITGRIFELEKEETVPLEHAVVTLNGSKTASDASGRFAFSAPPGTYLLDVSLPSIGMGKTAAEKLPMKIKVEAGKSSQVELHILTAATLKGQIVLKESPSVQGAVQGKPVFLGGPMATSQEIPHVFKGVLVELSRPDQVLRVLSDEEGNFAFLNIRPGAWRFKIYDYNLPAYYYVKNPEMDLTLSSGETRILDVKVVPRERPIEILEEGVIKKR